MVKLRLKKDRTKIEEVGNNPLKINNREVNQAFKTIAEQMLQNQQIGIEPIIDTPIVIEEKEKPLFDKKEQQHVVEDDLEKQQKS